MRARNELQLEAGCSLRDGDGHCMAHGEPDAVVCIRGAEKIRDEEFERLYGEVVARISADIAGNFEAALDQLEYNKFHEGRDKGFALCIAALRSSGPALGNQPRKNIVPILIRVLKDVQRALQDRESGEEE